MGIVKVKLIKDYMGTPAGTYIQVLDQKYKELVTKGYVADPDPEVQELKKKSKKQDVQDAGPED